MNIQEGFVLVPDDPIKAIDMGWAYLDAAREAEPNKSHSFSHAGYRAMIAAAPAADLPAYDEAKERELFEVYHAVASGLEGTDLETEFDLKEDGEYIYIMAADGWKYWKACAKSRDRSDE